MTIRPRPEQLLVENTRINCTYPSFPHNRRSWSDFIDKAAPHAPFCHGLAIAMQRGRAEPCPPANRIFAARAVDVSYNRRAARTPFNRAASCP